MKIEELINKHYNQLHENDFHILKYILNNKSSCYQLGINDLADKCNVSRSSILRLAQKLGFSGYSEFRVFLKWQDHEKVDSEVNSIGSLNEDIKETLKYTKTKDFQDICELIDRSERIFVYGTGSLQLNCADELQRMFHIMQRHLFVIRAPKEFEITLQSLKAEDLIIIISFSGDTPVIFPAVQSLTTKGIPFISITNLKSNKLATMTPYNLYASSSEIQSNDRFPINTFSSFFIIGETLFRHYVDYRKNIKF
ncbi:MurR/RpiR family transcriptional regulator [Halalkalibacter kiskunsagensis]|uniref:MurR/RpiR family transcriptional regulator n=1 Tax=Halalkalibacter kiskunsagensis TaxID=1548599 RepID=A0ABV6KCQ1_9BACI